MVCRRRRGFCFLFNRLPAKLHYKGIVAETSSAILWGGQRLFPRAGLHYRFVNHRMSGWIGRNTVNGVPSYEEYGGFTLRKIEAGPVIKGGRLIALSDKIWLELYIGLGVMRRKYVIVNEPDLRFQTSDRYGNIITTGERTKIPMLPAGARLLLKVN
jgi:hypothetical protein